VQGWVQYSVFLHPGWPLALKGLGLLAVIGFTNPGSLRRVDAMWRYGEFIGIVQWAVEWAIALAALAVVLTHPSLVYRSFWGALVAFSTAGNWLYYSMFRTRISAVEVVNGWIARTATKSMILVHSRQVAIALLLFAFCLALFFLPAEQQATFASWLALLPALSVALIVGEFRLQNGRTHTPMPAQFSVLSAIVLAAWKLWRLPPAQRGIVTWQPNPDHQKRSIVMLVDESIRGDYVSLRAGNELTPGLAALAGKLVNFGPAVSGSNNSHYSNGILRFGVAFDNVVQSGNTNATLFAYAKRAGYRTVYIDAQSGVINAGKGLQNLMTVAETKDIDAFYWVGKDAHADFELADVVAKELSSDDPVFIYANKNGAHFPFYWAYPESENCGRDYERNATRPFSGTELVLYRKAIAWTVDKFLTYLFKRADLSKADLIYTSDHGLLFRPGEMTHAQGINPDPRTGIVPLLAYSSDAKTRKAFEAGATRCRGRASHFLIAPTLYELMGYDRDDIARVYPATLFTGTDDMPKMVTGELFGLFKNAVEVTVVDPTLDYFEHELQPRAPASDITVGKLARA